MNVHPCPLSAGRPERVDGSNGAGGLPVRLGLVRNDVTTATPLVELIETRTSDGVLLAGALAEPPARDPQARFDAVLMMHGAGGRFYDAFFRNFSSALLAGTALEAVADCVLDWTAWLDVLAARGYARVLLFGHSLGAVKSAYVLATHPDARVTGCVLASPPRFNTARMLASERGAEFALSIAAARALVDAGTPDEFVRTTFPLKSFAGARAYLAKYTTGATFDVFAHVAKIACPVLAFTGSEELGDPTFTDHPTEYAIAKTTKPDIEFVVVPNGDHHYSRAQDFVVDQLLKWIG